MQFHHHGYVSTNPRVLPAAGPERSEALPDHMDVLIVGAGPAGMIAAAQLSMFPNVHTRIIDRRPHRLEIGQADGIQARSVETFQAFGFAQEITNEAFRITEMAFWKQKPDSPGEIHRTARTLDDEHGVSEFPHLIVNQARVLDYFSEFMGRSPSRMKPNFGYEFLGLEVGDGEYPVAVQLCDVQTGEKRTVYSKYVVGCDGARSGVRKAIGGRLEGKSANHAWGVMDVIAETDFPDIRLKCAINSKYGSILHIPREGGYLFRMYVDLGEVSEDDNGQVRSTTIEQIIDQANNILSPYTLDVREVCWHSVYEVGHRLANKFDNLSDECPEPRVFITGDACHTHSAKAGQGMNVSMQDGFNIAWKLGYVLDGRSPETLLRTYAEERKEIAKNLIDFDREWSTLMATPTEELENPNYLEDYYVQTAEFPAGFMTEYQPSILTGGKEHQDLAKGYPVGKRFKSAEVCRVADANPVHLGHHATADGRYRIYVFADLDGARAVEWAEWFAHDPDSPQNRYMLPGDEDAMFDVKIIYPKLHTDVDLNQVPSIFFPKCGPFRVSNYEKVYSVLPESSIFEEREISEQGAVVVVRPDQYVAAVLPLEDTVGFQKVFEPVLKG
ncbi:FAD-dependent monooxygenase [Corynebacterium pseudopelargi]|uniref:3-(3-hydroxy-phenyl)propionate/3-hydroxycinnamic acid hydroxylase n=1 Tax=Corynebacterium pseudopelargi TaxID=2080757 RepID=A0A3G6IYK9_9CORY|nr:FAD-dependent monooxygenase [Corynebacterium pseudopelargi]AZA09748.1 3-(3-hydroxy-phenyl)propionate/3-hydroxycinnamic acid hydroxylase [Corynebacterium pseudopelargi]